MMSMMMVLMMLVLILGVGIRLWLTPLSRVATNRVALVAVIDIAVDRKRWHTITAVYRAGGPLRMVQVVTTTVLGIRGNQGDGKKYGDEKKEK